MNLLLLLSAMLTALSGAGIGTRTASAPVAVNAIANVAPVTRVAPAVAAGRPIQTVPSPLGVSRGTVFAGWRLAPAAPLYLSRRRE